MKLIFIFIASLFQLINVEAIQETKASVHVLKIKTEHEKLTKYQFNLLKAAAKLLDKNIPNEALQSLETLNAYTQINWLRKADQELKDIAKQDMQVYTPEEQKEIEEMLTQLGFIEQIDPTIENPNMIVILGAQVNTMRKRIGYTLNLIEKRNWQNCKIILLTGDRPLFEDVETDEVLFDSKYIKIKYQDLNGEEYIEDYSGFDSICIQHEIDHQNGVMTINRANPFQQALLWKKYEQNNRTIMLNRR